MIGISFGQINGNPEERFNMLLIVIVVTLEIILIMLITNNTTEDITKVMTKNVVANVLTFSIDLVAPFISSKFVLIV